MTNDNPVNKKKNRLRRIISTDKPKKETNFALPAPAISPVKLIKRPTIFARSIYIDTIGQQQALPVPEEGNSNPPLLLEYGILLYGPNNKEPERLKLGEANSPENALHYIAFWENKVNMNQIAVSLGKHNEIPAAMRLSEDDIRIIKKVQDNHRLKLLKNKKESHSNV